MKQETFDAMLSEAGFYLTMNLHRIVKLTYTMIPCYNQIKIHAYILDNCEQSPYEFYTAAFTQYTVLFDEHDLCKTNIVRAIIKEYERN